MEVPLIPSFRAPGAVFVYVDVLRITVVHIDFVRHIHVEYVEAPRILRRIVLDADIVRPALFRFEVRVGKPVSIRVRVKHLIEAWHRKIAPGRRVIENTVFVRPIQGKARHQLVRVFSVFHIPIFIAKADVKGRLSDGNGGLYVRRVFGSRIFIRKVVPPRVAAVGILRLFPAEIHTENKRQRSDLLPAVIGGTERIALVISHAGAVGDLSFSLMVVQAAGIGPVCVIKGKAPVDVYKRQA